MILKRIVSLTALLCLPSWAFAAAPVLIANVPDWNQPSVYGGVPDFFAQPPDPPPFAGGVANWCTPTATANIMGWYEDTQGAVFSGLGDGQVYFAHQTPYPNLGVADLVPDYQQNQWMDGSIELGYFMDTQGWQTGAPGHFGTLIGGVLDIPAGIKNYLNTYSPTTSWSVWNYDVVGDGGNVNNGFADIRNGGFAPTLPPLGPVPNNGIDSGDPLLVHWDVWLGNQPGWNDGNGTTWYDWSQQTPGGHTVTAVGYAFQYDPDGAAPLFGVDDWVIVHDDWLNTGDPMTGNVAVPFWYATGLTYWQGNTHLEYLGLTEFGVPEPGVALLLALGGLVLLARRRT